MNGSFVRIFCVCSCLIGVCLFGCGCMCVTLKKNQSRLSEADRGSEPMVDRHSFMVHVYRIYATHQMGFWFYKPKRMCINWNINIFPCNPSNKMVMCVSANVFFSSLLSNISLAKMFGGSLYISVEQS